MGFKGIKNVGLVDYNGTSLYNFKPNYFVIIDASHAQELLDSHTNAGITGLSCYPKLTAMPSYISATIAGWTDFSPYSPFPTHPAWPTMVF